MNTAEKTAKYLFATPEEMDEAGLAPAMREHLLRLRKGYVYWTSRPSLFDRQVIEFIESESGVSYRTAWEDVKIIKQLLGNMQDASQQYQRWLFQQRWEEAWDAARMSEHPARDMASLLATFARAARLDKPELSAPDYSQIVPETFEITADPEDAGFKRIPGIEEKARKMLSHWKTETN